MCGAPWVPSGGKHDSGRLTAAPLDSPSWPHPPLRRSPVILREASPRSTLLAIPVALLGVLLVAKPTFLFGDGGGAIRRVLPQDARAAGRRPAAGAHLKRNHRQHASRKLPTRPPQRAGSAGGHHAGAVQQPGPHGSARPQARACTAAVAASAGGATARGQRRPAERPPALGAHSRRPCAPACSAASTARSPWLPSSSAKAPLACWAQVRGGWARPPQRAAAGWEAQRKLPLCSW